MSKSKGLVDVSKNSTCCPSIGCCENLQETTMFGGEKAWFSLQPPLLRTETSTATEFEKNVEATIRPAGKWLITRFCHGFAKKNVVEWDIRGISCGYHGKKSDLYLYFVAISYVTYGPLSEII
jgi:hypothetical protein